MAALFGIHFGNSSACVAFSKDDERVEVIANDTGDRLTPTTVQWTPSQSLVGRSAVLEKFRYMTSTITRSKQLLNLDISEEELKSLRSQVPFKIHSGNGQIMYELLDEGKQYQISAKEVILAVFQKIHSIAMTSVRKGVELQAVLSVPSYFSLRSIQCLREIAEKAGFSVLQVIDEASAAVLAAYPADKEGKCLVCRVGGVSLDITVVDISNGMYTILSNSHKSDTGGRYITEKLRNFLESEFQRQYKNQEITERGRFKLESTAETAKQILSIQNVAQCSAESIGSGFDLNCSVSRPRLDNIVSCVLPTLVDAIREAIVDAKLSPEVIDSVIVCGGTTKIPRVQEQIRALLPRAEIYGTSSPEELIAIGCALQARYCSKITVDLPVELSLDISVTAADVGINFFDAGKNELLSESISAGTCLPISREISLSNDVNYAEISFDSDPPLPFYLGSGCTVDLNIHSDGVFKMETVPQN